MVKLDVNGYNKTLNHQKILLKHKTSRTYSKLKEY